MTAEYTRPQDVFSPEVIGGVIDQRLKNSYALFQTGVVGEVRDATWSEGGRTVTFISKKGFGGNPIQALPEDGSSVQPKRITYGYYTKTAIGRIGSVAMVGTTLEDAAASTNVYNDLVQDMTDWIADDIDNALVTEAYATPDNAALELKYDGGGTPDALSYNYLADAVGMWGDKQRKMKPVLIVHSKVFNQMKKLNEVRTLQAFGPASPLFTGDLFQFQGMPVFVSDNIAVVTNGGGTGVDSYLNLLVQPGALEFGFRRAVKLEEKKTPGNDTTYLDFTYRRIAHKRETNPLGLIIVESL